MDLPIQRLPPVVGPRPAPPIPRMGDRQKRGERKFSLDEENEQNEGEAETGSENADETNPDHEETIEVENNDNNEDKESAIAPPPAGEAGSTIDLTA